MVSLSASRRIHTAIQLVQLQAVRLAQTLPLAQFHRPVSSPSPPSSSAATLLGRQRRLPPVLGKVRPPVVHDRSVIVFERIARVLQRLALEIIPILGQNVVPVDAHEPIPIGARLLVEQTQRVHQLVQRPSLAAQAVGAARVRRLQRHDLRPTDPTHVRPAATRIANGPDEEVVGRSSVPRFEVDARDEGEGSQGGANGDDVRRFVERTDGVRNGGVRPEAIGKDVPTARDVEGGGVEYTRNQSVSFEE